MISIRWEHNSSFVIKLTFFSFCFSQSLIEYDNEFYFTIIHAVYYRRRTKSVKEITTIRLVKLVWNSLTKLNRLYKLFQRLKESLQMWIIHFWIFLTAWNQLQDLDGLNIYDILEPCYHAPNAQMIRTVNSRLPPSFRQLGETDRPLAVRKRMFGRAWPFRAPVREGLVPTWPQILNSASVPCIVCYLDSYYFIFVVPPYLVFLNFPAWFSKNQLDEFISHTFFATLHM